MDKKIISYETRDTIIEMAEGGMSYLYIARRLKIDITSVYVTMRYYALANQGEWEYMRTISVNHKNLYRYMVYRFNRRTEPDVLIRIADGLDEIKTLLKRALGDI